MAELADPRASRAVLVGSARYGALPEVPAVARNLIALSGVFADPDLWGLAPEHCTVLADHDDPRLVSRELRRAADEVQPEGMLVVYYAGHGLVDPVDGSLALALRDTDPAVPHEAGLPFEHLRRAVAASRARRRLVILDCCYAGRAAGHMAAGESGTQVVADQAGTDETCLLVSAPRNRTAQAPPGEPYTAFTGELLRVLRGGLPDRPAVLDVRTVWREVTLRLRERGFELPELRTGNAGDELALVRNAARHHRDLVGRVVVATAAVDDRDLRQAAVLILRHERGRGAVGVRINTPTGHPLPAEITAGWRRLLTPPAVVFDAGPLSRAEGFVAVARLRPDVEPPLRFRPVRERLGVIALSADPAPLAPVIAGLRLFSGYLGWGPEQLESDIDGGLLLLSDSDVREVHSSRPRELWTTLHARARGDSG
ncbi:YqgE/AlgH family protein [Dactylosporangium roseum]|uniref:YqgE/AlgH family protein n=1 Tax=Dactylosporangium roseum TaxID=47989 RepID=A0ABY5ZB63_9ACTN|nr:YqgE/AlgH family protein [Dactylosporangium roseum]UWZ38836.1 YqgE/AlgH family protein [Dactylosporangium roseum]